MIINDLRKSLSFYYSLGVEIPEGQDNEFHFESTDKRLINWLSSKMNNAKKRANWVEPTGNGKINLRFESASPIEVDATYSTLIEQGYTSFEEPWDVFWGQRFAQVLDPDGNNIGTFAPLKND